MIETCATTRPEMQNPPPHTRLLHPNGEMMSLAHPFVRDIFLFLFGGWELRGQGSYLRDARWQLLTPICERQVSIETSPRLHATDNMLVISCEGKLEDIEAWSGMLAAICGHLVAVSKQRGASWGLRGCGGVVWGSLLAGRELLATYGLKRDNGKVGNRLRAARYGL